MVANDVFIGLFPLRTATVRSENGFLTGPSRPDARQRAARVLTVYATPPPGPRARAYYTVHIFIVLSARDKGLMPVVTSQAGETKSDSPDSMMCPG